MDTIKISGLPAVLSTIPLSLGRHPNKSLVAVCLDGKSVRATVRVDAPHYGIVLPDYAEQFAGYLAKTGCDGCFLALFDEDAVDGCEPYAAEGMEYLSSYLFTTQNMNVLGMALVTAEYWMDYDAPYGVHARRPLVEIEMTNYVAELVANGKDQINVHTIPVPDPEVSPAFDKTLAKRTAAVLEASTMERREIAENTYALWLKTLASNKPVSNAAAVRLLGAMSLAGIRDGIMVRCFIDDLPEDEYGQVMMGDLTFPFDRARFFRGWELLTQLATKTADPARRADLLAMLGFMLWFQGQASHAMDTLAAALQAQPEHRLSHLLEQMVQMGRLSPAAAIRSNWFDDAA